MTESSDERPAETAAPDRRSVLRTTVGGSDDRGGASRRGVLAGAAASVAAALGLTGTAAAGTTDPGRAARVRRVEARYRSEDVARETLRTHGAEVLDRLVAKGLLERGDVAELDAPEVNAVDFGDEPTAHVAAETAVDGGVLTVVAEPEAGRQYAVLDHDDGDGMTIFDPELEDVEPREQPRYGCNGGGCHCPEYELGYYDGNCYSTGTTGRFCFSCSACSSPPCGF